MKLKAQIPILTAAIIATAGLVGCESSTKYDDITYNNPIVDEFTASPDRVPTAQTLYAMARILVARNLDDKARYVLERITREYPKYAPAYIDLAEMQMRDDDIDAAVATLKAGLEVAPDNAVMNNNLGICYMIEEDYARATVAFEEAIKAEPRVARYRANLAMAYGMLGQYDKALSTYAYVVAESDAHFNLAVIAEARGDTARAEIEYAIAETLGQ